MFVNKSSKVPDVDDQTVNLVTATEVQRPGRWKHPRFIGALGLTILVLVVLTVVVVLLPQGPTDNQGETKYSADQVSLGPDSDVRSQCHRHALALDYRVYVDGEYCTYVVGKDPKVLVEEEEARHQCQDMGGGLPYFDNVAEECIIGNYARLDLVSNTSQPQRFWITKFQYFHEQEKDQRIIHWDYYRKRSYPMRVCRGVNLNQPKGTGWAMTFQSGEDHQFGCWRPYPPHVKARMICKVCKPGADRDQLVSLTVDDLSRYLNGTPYSSLPPHHFCTSTDTKRLYSSEDKFSDRPVNKFETFIDGLQPGCRYYTLGKKYNYSQAVAECTSLDSKLVWFDSIEEECKLVRTLPALSSLQRTWIHHGNWTRYSKSQSISEFVVVYPHRKVPFIMRMCHENQIYSSSDRLRMTLQYGSPGQECWDLQDISEMYKVICKRCDTKLLN